METAKLTSLCMYIPACLYFMLGFFFLAADIIICQKISGILTEDRENINIGSHNILGELYIRDAAINQDAEHSKQKSKLSSSPSNISQLSTENQFGILWISDIHVDPYYSADAPATKFCHSKEFEVENGNDSGNLGISSSGRSTDRNSFAAGRAMANADTGNASRSKKLGNFAKISSRSLYQRNLTEGSSSSSYAHDPFDTNNLLGKCGCDSPVYLVDKSLEFARTLLQISNNYSGDLSRRVNNDAHHQEKQHVDDIHVNFANSYIDNATILGQNIGKKSKILSRLRPRELSEILQSTAAGKISDPEIFAAAAVAVEKTISIDTPMCPVSVLIVSGDLPLRLPVGESKKRLHAIRLMITLLKKHFPTGEAVGRGNKNENQIRQIIYSPGNNDMSDDYVFAWKRPEWNKRIYDALTGILPDDDATKETFLRCMYYATTLWNRPEVLVLSVNTNLYSTAAWNTAAYLFKTTSKEYQASHRQTFEIDMEDPGGQFKWMRERFASARANQQQVIIVGHIMPGLNELLAPPLLMEHMWLSKYHQKYRDIILENSDLLLTQLYGHVHSDMFRVIKYDDNKISLSKSDEVNSQNFSHGSGQYWCQIPKKNDPSLLLVVPSISPVHCGNPAMRILLFRERNKNNEEDNEFGKSTKQQNVEAVTSPSERESVHVLHDVINEGSTFTIVKKDTSISSRLQTGPMPEQPICSFMLVDYVQYRLPLYGYLPQGSEKKATYSFEYSFQDTYGDILEFEKFRQNNHIISEDEEHFRRRRCLDGHLGLALAKGIRDSPVIYALYEWHRTGGGAKISNTHRFCEIQSLETEDIEKCLNTHFGP